MNTSIIIWFFQLRQEEGVNLSLVVMHWIYLYYNFTTLYKICICFQLVPLSSFRHCWAGGDDDDHYFSNSCYASYMADTHHCSAEFCCSLPGIGVDFLFISSVECNGWKLDYIGLCCNNVFYNVCMELWEQAQVWNWSKAKAVNGFDARIRLQSWDNTSSWDWFAL